MVKFTVLNLWKNWGNLIFKCGKKPPKRKKMQIFSKKKLATLVGGHGYREGAHHSVRLWSWAEKVDKLLESL